MGFLLSKLLPLGLYPLGLALLLQIAALLGHRRPWAPWVSGSGIALLWLFAMPLTSRQLIWSLEERGSQLMPSPLPPADAVVVLGGGVLPPLAPRTAVEVNEAGDRLLTGVRLLRQGQAPLLVVSGGSVSFTDSDPAPSQASSAALLARSLGIPAGRIQLSGRARNTAEEAQALNAMAVREGWRRILLVTSASHLPRSVASFRRLSQLEIVPVACDFRLPARSLMGRPTAASLALDLLPDAEALQQSSVALKEHLGLLVYRLRGWS